LHCNYFAIEPAFKMADSLNSDLTTDLTRELIDMHLQYILKCIELLPCDWLIRYMH